MGKWGHAAKRRVTFIPTEENPPLPEKKNSVPPKSKSKSTRKKKEQ